MAKYIEIIGVAGTGKSTLTKKIGERNPGWSIQFRLPRLKTIQYQAGTLLKNLIPLIRYSEKNWFFSNVKMVLHIDALTKYLIKYEKLEQEFIVFDQGVIFEYASLCNIGLKNAPDEYINNLYRRSVDGYLRSLSYVVFLKAKEEVILKRVENRISDHRLKEFSKSERLEFFASYKKVYEHINNELVARNVPVIEIETSVLDEEQVFSYFKAELGI